MRLIDADALIKERGEWYTEEGTEEGFIGTVKNLIDAQPTIEPDCKTGKWKPKMYRAIDGTLTQKQDKWYGYFYVCDQCGFEMLGTENFCPGCGLPMEVET